jgi:toxin secretion/phage lysis holin
VTLDDLKVGGFLVGAAVAGLWASIGVAVQALLVLMVLDLISGTIAGSRGPGLDSAVGIRGWRRKALTLIVVLAVAYAEGVTGLGLPAVQVVAGGFVGLEFLSIVENGGRAGVRYPKMVRQALTKLRAQLEGDGDGEGTEVAPTKVTTA